MQLAEVHQQDSASVYPVVRGDSTGASGSAISEQGYRLQQELAGAGSSHIDPAIEAGLAESTSRQAGRTRSLLERSQKRGRRMRVQLVISVVIAVLAVTALLIVLFSQRRDEDRNRNYRPDSSQRIWHSQTTLISSRDL